MLRVISTLLVCLVLSLSLIACANNRAIEEAPSKLRVGAWGFAVIDPDRESFEILDDIARWKEQPEKAHADETAKENVLVVDIDTGFAFRAAQVLRDTPRATKTGFVPDDPARYSYPIAFAFYLPSDDGEFWHRYVLGVETEKNGAAYNYSFFISEERIYEDFARNHGISGGESSATSSAIGSSFRMVYATPELDELWQDILLVATLQGALNTGLLDVEDLIK